MSKLYLIRDIEGFTPEISRLISMMTWARATTLQSVRDLSVEQLDYLLDEQSNSIGAILLHAAAVEVAYQVTTFDNRVLSDQEKEQWGAALDLGGRGRIEIKGRPLSDYIAILNDVRQNTLNALKERHDEWLLEETPWWGDRPANNYFKWVHVFEDEINHRGQIRIIKKYMPQVRESN
jgi:uncharacterized damage-inducible protein DinB